MLVPGASPDLQGSLQQGRGPLSCCKHIMAVRWAWSLTHPTLVLESPTQVLREQPPKSAFSWATWKLQWDFRTELAPQETLVWHSKLMAVTLLFIWTAPGYLLHQSWDGRTQFLEPPFLSNFFSKWFAGKLKSQSSHLPTESSLKHYNHVQKIISSFHPSFCAPRGSSSLWEETIKVAVGRELAQAYTALLRALL